MELVIGLIFHNIHQQGNVFHWYHRDILDYVRVFEWFYLYVKAYFLFYMKIIHGDWNCVYMKERVSGAFQFDFLKNLFEKIFHWFSQKF